MGMELSVWGDGKDRKKIFFQGKQLSEYTECFSPKSKDK